MTRWAPRLLAGVVTVSVVAGFTLWWYPRERAAAVASWRRDLDVRADIRRDAIQRYFVDGLADAEVFAAYSGVLQFLGAASVGAGRPASAAEGSAAHLEEHFDSHVRIHGIVGVVLWNAEGKVAARSRGIRLDDACAAPAREVLASGSPATGLHLHSGFGPILTFSSPVRFPDGSVRGAVVIAEDPKKWLYPLLSQPLAGTMSGESLLVGRDGADALFLSPLRGRPDAPLTFRRPLDAPGFAARAALEGSEAVGSYVDYRGVPVLSVGRRIPPSPWALVVKIDEKEAMAEFQAEARRTGFAWGSLLVAFFGIAWGLWQMRERAHAASLARSDERTATLLDNAADPILLVGEDLIVRHVNLRAEEFYGRPKSTLAGTHIRDLRPEEDRAAVAVDFTKVGQEGHALFETRHVAAGDLVVPVEVHWRKVTFGDETLFLSIVRDISERKRAEGRIRHLNRLLKTISEINQIIVRVEDRTTLLAKACETLVEHGGFRMAWIGFVDPRSSRVVPEARAGEGQGYLDGIEIRTDDLPEGRGPTGTAIRTGRHVVVSDLATDASVAPWRERMLESGFRSVGSFPLSVRGEVTGTLAVYRNDLVPFSDEETSLLDELAADIGYALGVLEIRDENRRAGEALRENEERFRLAAETAADVIYEWDIGTRIQWFGNVDELMGYSPGEFPRTLEGWADLVHPEDREQVMAAVDRQLKGEVPYDVEYRVKRRDGTYGYWWARGSVLRDAAGKPYRWVGSITDITDRKRAERALRESESRFRQLAESLPQLVWTCQPDGPCDYLNRQWIEFTGVPEAQQIGFGWLEQLHPDDRAPTVAAWEAAVASGGNFHVEFRIRRHDGEYRWFDTRAVRLLDAEAHTVKWYGSNTDITERRRAEIVLRESEARYRTLLANIPQKIFLKSRTSRYISVNENYARDFGLRPEDVVGKEDYDFFPREDADKYRADDKRVMDTAQAEEFEERYMQGSHEKWIHTIKTPVRDRGGEIIGILGVFWDITERKRADEALRESENNLRVLTEELEKRVEARTAELAAANRELEAFSYSVSHDLRAPLRAMDGFSRILLEDHAKQLDAEGKRVLGVVRASTVQMGHLIDDLLSFSRLGRQKMERTEVDMEALAKAAFRELVTAGEEVSFTVGPLPRASADLSLMRQVFMNLISNALKFTGPKAERTIEVGSRTEPNRIVYWVKDNGVGFDMAYADKLFGVFQRLHSADEFEGNGVGLALVQRIVHRHGGKVWADGKVGEGATFSFSLPRPGGF